MPFRLLNYRHNATASSLRRADRTRDRRPDARRRLEPILVGHDRRPRRCSPPARNAGLCWLLAGGNAEREAQFVRALAARQVDGLIVMPVGVDHGTLLRERQLGLPMVFVDRLATSAAR